MAILIVDDETNTREALRKLLSHLGHKVILEAKNGEEALKIAQLEKSRIEMIIADLEMPYMNGLSLLKKVGELSSLDLAPFLLITSDLLHSQLKNYQVQYPRLDHCLLKPFRITTLAAAMKQASIHRTASRNQILVVSRTEIPILAHPLQSLIKGHWTSLMPIRSIETLKSNRFDQKSEIGAWFLNISSFSDDDKLALKDVLSKFKKTPLGTQTPLVCMGSKPEEVYHFRTLCQYYWSPTPSLSSWASILSEIENRLISAWEINLLFQQIKTLMKEHNWTEAWKLALKILKLAPNHYEIQTLCGDILESLQRFDEAIQFYQKAADLNPTATRSYIKLFQLLPKDSQRNTSLLEFYIHLAIQYCPKNSDILYHAAKIQMELGLIEQAKMTLRSLLSEHPQNRNAQSLLEEIP